MLYDATANDGKDDDDDHDDDEDNDDNDDHDVDDEDDDGGQQKIHLSCRMWIWTGSSICCHLSAACRAISSLQSWLAELRTCAWPAGVQR